MSNDTLAPLRARLGATTTRSRTTPPSRALRGRGRASAARAVAKSLAATAPPTVAGRWSLLPAPEPSPTVRATALAEQLLERHGVVTRGAVMSEGVIGGFATAYKVLSGLEETGRTRRGYFIEGLGAAQFATPATVDRLRAIAADGEDLDTLDHRNPPVTVTLSATDPANPFGAALGWPTVDDDRHGGHRPGRKAGALVVLVDGALALFIERGGKTVLTFTAEPALFTAAAESLTTTIRATGGRLRVEKIDGVFAVGTALGDALVSSGFVPTPQGLRLRG